MLWGGRRDGELVGPWQIPDGVKMTAQTYIDLLKADMQSKFMKKPNAFRKMMILLHNNVSSQEEND